MIRLPRSHALELAHETIVDLRRRLDDAEADRSRILHQLLALRREGFSPEAPRPEPTELAGFLPSVVMDEIELVSASRSMSAHLETWARAELGRGTPVEVVIQRIRDGDSIG